jgi:iron(III) transport system substrate-binding protein
MRSRWLVGALVIATASLSSCGGGDPGALSIYTSVTQGTVDSVVTGFAAEYPDVDIEVFRAPTGELAARIAAEQREGGLGADVLWLTDPLSMQQYAADGALRSWDPVAAADLPAQYTTDSFWGTRILTMVMVVGDGVVPPESWHDLADPRFSGKIALPDPGFAGSSLAVLGYFAATADYGMDFYQLLADNGAVQVSAPGEVVSGVAEGRFLAGITLEFSARNAIGNGSPLSIVWPSDGAISLYSPIAVTVASDAVDSAENYVEYVLGLDGQQRIAATGWQPISPDIAWDVGGELVTVDWTDLFDRQAELLDQYRAIFGL